MAKPICTLTGLPVFERQSDARDSAAAQTHDRDLIHRATGECGHCKGFHVVREESRRAGERPRRPQPRPAAATRHAQPRFWAQHLQLCFAPRG